MPSTINWGILVGLTASKLSIPGMSHFVRQTRKKPKSFKKDKQGKRKVYINKIDQLLTYDFEHRD